ncbi:MAG: Aquaporin Z, partial [uncultured Blastococcus sp.]
ADDGCGARVVDSGGVVRQQRRRAPRPGRGDRADRHGDPGLRGDQRGGGLGRARHRRVRHAGGGARLRRHPGGARGRPRARLGMSPEPGGDPRSGGDGPVPLVGRGQLRGGPAGGRGRGRPGHLGELRRARAQRGGARGDAPGGGGLDRSGVRRRAPGHLRPGAGRRLGGDRRPGRERHRTRGRRVRPRGRHLRRRSVDRGRGQPGPGLRAEPAGRRPGLALDLPARPNDRRGPGRGALRPRPGAGRTAGV